VTVIDCAGGRHNMPRPAPCKLTFWPWKWCPSHVRLSANCSLPRPLCSRRRPDIRNRRTDRSQTRIIA